MNQEKIGKFIAELRKEKKLTQIELAKRIGVSNKAVSKWECGNAIPDYGMFEILCKEFNISVNELLNGEKDKKDEKVIVEYMKMKGKQNRAKIIVTLVISFLIVVSSVLGIYFINSYDKTNIYQLSGNSDNFIFKDGLLVTSNIKNIFQKGKLDIKNHLLSNDVIAETYYAFKINSKYYKLIDYEGDSIVIENYGEDLIIPSDMIEYVPDNLYLIVVYYENEEVQIEYIKVKSKKIFSNNKFINLKSEPNEDSKIELVDLDKVFDPFKYRDQLLKEGFKKPTKEDLEKTYGIETSLVKKIGNEKIFIDYINYNLFYYVDNEEYDIVSVPRNLEYSSYCKNDIIGSVDLYVSGEKDGQVIFSRAYSSCTDVLIRNDLPFDISKDIERFKELNKLYIYKEEK